MSFFVVLRILALTVVVQAGCTPSRFWYLGRHASCFYEPVLTQEMIEFSESTIKADIAANFDAGRTTLCRRDFEAIQNWTRAANFTLENSLLTTEAGVVAMQNIARRYQQHYPDILTNTYSQGRFLFRHTASERTNESLRAFANGLFGDVGSENVIYEDVPEVDWFLSPYNFCPAFDAAVADQHQRDAFGQGPEIEEMLQEINRKLGFHGSNQLSFSTVFIMWEWCAFETTSTFEFSDSDRGNDSPWCAPFSIAHHLLIEYYLDLFHFHYGGYGNSNQRLLENLSCGLMQDLLTYMQSNNNSDQMARFFLSYSQAIQGMLVTLGAFRDVWPLHQHNYAQQSARHWLTSIINPFSTNLAVVRHDCADSDHELVFLLNERPILIPGCDQQTGVCKLSVIISRMQRFLGVNCEELFCTEN